MKKYRILLAVLAVGVFGMGCGEKEKQVFDKKMDKEAVTVVEEYDFEKYESLEDILSIEKVQLEEQGAQYVTSYRFTYQSDDAQVVGYIGIPKECIEKKKPYPVIVYNRGGNRDYGALQEQEIAYMSYQFNSIVIGSQYRGTSGSTGEDQYGGKDVEDVEKLLDLCEEFSFADMDNLCMMGASRGGMMSYMVARQDDRVKRLVIISGLTDLFQSYEERSDMQELLKELIAKTPQEAPEEYEKRSAICWADEIKIPVLMFHSRKDEKVSFSQAEAMYQALKEEGTECSFVVYEDDIHGMREEEIPVINQWLKGEDISKYTVK